MRPPAALAPSEFVAVIVTVPLAVPSADCVQFQVPLLWLTIVPCGAVNSQRHQVLRIRRTA